MEAQLERVTPRVAILLDGVGVVAGGCLTITFGHHRKVFGDLLGVQTRIRSFLDADNRQQAVAPHNPVNEPLQNCRANRAPLRVHDVPQGVGCQLLFVHGRIAALGLQVGLVNPVRRVERIL